MLSIFQVAGSVAQRPGRKGTAIGPDDGRDARGPHTQRPPVGPGQCVSRSQGSCYFFKQNKKDISCNWLAMLFKQSDKTPYVLVWEPGCRGMQTKQRASQKPARMDWDACTRRECWRHHHVAWGWEGLWSQRPISSCVKGSWKNRQDESPGKMCVLGRLHTSRSCLPRPYPQGDNNTYSSNPPGVFFFFF